MERPAFACCASYVGFEVRRSAEREGGSGMRESWISLRSIQATRSQQPQPAQLAAQSLGHFAGAGRGAVEVLGRVLDGEIAPALERAVQPRLREHQLAVEHQAAAADAVLVDERQHGDDALAAQDLAADHPIERAARAQLVGALRHHARGVDVLGWLPALLLLGELLADPVAQVFDRVAADAELDEMQGHVWGYRSLVIHSAAAITMTFAPSAIWLPGTAAISATVPAIGAVNACSIFIASIRATRWPLATAAPGSTRIASTLPCMGAVTRD